MALEVPLVLARIVLVEVEKSVLHLLELALDGVLVADGHPGRLDGQERDEGARPQAEGHRGRRRRGRRQRPRRRLCGGIGENGGRGGRGLRGRTRGRRRRGCRSTVSVGRGLPVSVPIHRDWNIYKLK